MMDPSPILRQQNQNKIHSDFLRMTSEHNKLPEHPKFSKPWCALHHYQDENNDPQKSAMGRKAPVRPGVSRLPVLAKSLHLQTPSDFSQSHCKWEEKPLAGKAKKKKPCTRPIPFSLSHSKISRTISENEQLLTVTQSRNGAHTVQPNNNSGNVLLKPANVNAKHTKHSATLDSSIDSAKLAGKSNGKPTENTSQFSGQCGTVNTFMTPASLSHLLPSSSNDAHRSNNTASSAQAAVNAEACVDNMNLLSLKDPTKTSHANQNMQLTEQDTFSKRSTDKGESFQSDHAALLSILRNEGISATGLGSVTPKSKPYNYLPQRVSVMKSRQKDTPTAGLIKLEHFSPDSPALQSILQNEGVKVGGATPQTAVRPSGRGTSLYAAQRVPARKHHVEANGAPAPVDLKEASVKKWTPQRVRNTRPQPMSAMKWHLSSQPSPYSTTPGPRNYKTNLKPHQEEIVQRLFDDQEDEQSTNVADKDPEIQEQQPIKATTATKSHSKEKVEVRGVNTTEDEEQRVAAQPFIQAPQRESVIFFSTGKKLLRVPRFEQQESSSHHEEDQLVSSDLRKVLSAHAETSSVPEPTYQITPVYSLHRDLTVQKTSAQSSAVALLRKRLPPVEELRLDEEVATYTSTCVSAAPGFVPPRPRCGNPLASILHFEESSRFVPIGLGLSSDPSSPCSTMKER